jgi:hypothetical protein
MHIFAFLWWAIRRYRNVHIQVTGAVRSYRVRCGFSERQTMRNRRKRNGCPRANRKGRGSYRSTEPTLPGTLEVPSSIPCSRLWRERSWSAGSREARRSEAGSPDSMMSPLSKTTIRSATSRAEPISCVEMRVVIPSSRTRSLITDNTSFPFPAVQRPVTRGRKEGTTGRGAVPGRGCSSFDVKEMQCSATAFCSCKTSLTC